MIEFALEGDWNGAARGLRSLPLNIRSSALWGQRKASEKLVKIVRQHLLRQDLPWAPLAAGTLAQKNDGRILIDTYQYISAIKSWQKGFISYAGVPRGTFNNRGIDISYIASIHEFKSYNGGPYRALWGPSMDEMGGASGIRDIIMASIAAKLNKMRLKGFDIK